MVFGQGTINKILDITLVASQITFAVSWSSLLGIESISLAASLISMIITTILWLCYTFLQESNQL